MSLIENPSKNVKVSVIIPVYMAAEFIEKCARSLFEQTLEELEYIFIDDNSPDDSIEILEKIIESYPLRKPYIKIIRLKENIGVSAVRKYGIQQAIGDYIVHCDSDDWIDPNLYQAMYETAIKSDSQIVFCDLVFEYKNKSRHIPAGNIAETGKEQLRTHTQRNVPLYLPAKMVKRTLHVDNDIYPWPGLNMCEDNALMLRLLYFAKRLAKVEGPSYHYNHINAHSITANLSPSKIQQLIENLSKVTDFYQTKPDKEKFETTVNIFKYMARLSLISDSYKNYFLFLKTFPESKKAGRKYRIKNLSPKERLKISLVRNGLGLIYITLFKAKQYIKKLK